MGVVTNETGLVEIRLGNRELVPVLIGGVLLSFFKGQLSTRGSIKGGLVRGTILGPVKDFGTLNGRHCLGKFPLEGVVWCSPSPTTIVSVFATMIQATFRVSCGVVPRGLELVKRFGLYGGTHFHFPRERGDFLVIHPCTGMHAVTLYTIGVGPRHTFNFGHPRKWFVFFISKVGVCIRVYPPECGCA